MTMSDEAKIELGENGPLKVTGVTSMTDAAGNAIECKERMFLCRCGQSANKPFCDGTHKKVGWTS